MSIFEQVINNPNYLAYKFNFNNESIEFIPIDDKQIRRVSFLRQKAIGLEKKFVSIPLSDFVELISTQQNPLVENPPCFIFHTGFCASTFLSRCLDVPGQTISLREPQLLSDSANAKRIKWKSNTTNFDYRDLVKLAILLLQKHAQENERLIIKPINSVNNIIPEILEVCSSSKAVMLHTDVRGFLLSSLKKGEAGKQTTRSMFDLIRCDFPHLDNLSLSNVIHMSDIKIILTLWRLQIEQAESVLKKYSNKKMMVSIYGETIISNPSGTLNAVNVFLDLGFSTDKINEIINSDSLNVDAKDINQKFSVQQRNALLSQVEEFYGVDISNGINWMLKNNPSCSAIPKLSGQLNIN